MEDIQAGIVRVSAVPVYSKPSFISQLIDQYLYGELYHVLWKHKQYPFLYVSNHHNKSMGWMLEGQHTAISKELFVEITAVDIRIVSDTFALLSLQDKKIHLCVGARLPLAGTELFPLENIVYNGNYVLASQRKTIDYAIEKVSCFEGIPYLRGGRTPFGFDAPSLIIVLYRLMGIELAKNSDEMETYGKWIASYDDIEKGDLVFFSNSVFQIYHVGIYLGNNIILHVNNTVRKSKISADGILNEDNNYVEYKIFSIKRVLKSM